MTITAEDEVEYEGEEGGVLLKLHRSRERDSKLVRRKRVDVLNRTGGLACEVCSLDFSARYWELGEGYIEVRHLKPVASFGGSGKTKLSDLAVVCANCHRKLHRGRRLQTLEDLHKAMAGAV